MKSPFPALESHFKDGDRPVIMGILNVTPDSFSDGGDYYNRDEAIKQGFYMVNQGADIIDIGGESTRPGAARISAEDQISRIVPVIKGLSRIIPEHILISVDTTLTSVLEAAIAAGAGMINDVSAGEDDQGIFQLAAERQIPLVLMHKQGTPESMQDNPAYENAIEDIRSYLLGRADLALKAGNKKENLILDPGFGFGKKLPHNLQILSRLDRLVDTGIDIMIGASRKTFLSNITSIASRKELIGATCATTVIGVLAGVRYFRVHDVKENRQAADVAYATLKQLATSN